MASESTEGGPGLVRKLLSHASPKPVYKQLGDWLRSQVLSGRWGTHHKLDSETRLADKFGVSRGTVRKAVEELIDEGLLTRTHGKGTFVSDRTLEQRVVRMSAGSTWDLLSEGTPFATTVLHSGVQSAADNVALSLAIAPGDPVFALDRVRRVWDSPVAFLQNLVIYNLCPGIDREDFQTRRLCDVIEETYHHTIGWGKRSFEARAATKDVGRILKVGEGDPVMYMEQITYLTDSTPIEASKVWLRGDHYKITTSVLRSESESGREFPAGRRSRQEWWPEEW